MSQAGSSPISYALAILLFVTSYFWLDYGGDSLLEMRAWLSGSQDGTTAISVPNTLGKKKPSYKELLLQVKELKREVHKYRKLENEDLDFLIAQVNGSFYRINKSVYMINLGEDYGVEKGDLAVQGKDVVGKVIEVAKTCSLVESTSSPFSNYYVRIEGIKESEFIWSGKGNNDAVVHLSKSNTGLAPGDYVFLSASDSLGGNFIMGQVMKINRETQKGWREIHLKGKEINPFKAVMILKETERKERDLFEKRDQLSELKTKIKNLELIKLRLELSKK
jgi:hypothetical protein